MTKKRKRSIKSTKKAAWIAFSKYIRLRDSIATTGTTDYCVCITCLETVPTEYSKGLNTLQAGHAIAGRSKNILFDEDLVYGQCAACNCIHGGRLSEFACKMIDKFGKKWFEARCFISRKPAETRWSIQELDEIKQKYKDKYEELLNNGIVKNPSITNFDKFIESAKQFLSI